jgi:YVTN family beta-propeller protein
MLNSTIHRLLPGLLPAILFLFVAAGAGAQTGTAPGTGLAATPRKLFVVNVADSSVSLVDISTLKELKRFKVGPLPYFVAVSGDNRTLAVSVEGEEKVKFYDTRTLQQKGEVHIGPLSSDHMVMFPDGVHALMADRTGNALVVLNLQTQQAETRIPDVSSPHNIRMGESGRYAYVTSKLNPGISVVDLEQRKVKAFYSVKLIPRGLAVSPDEKTIYFGANWISGVFMMDAATGAIRNVAEIPLPGKNRKIGESTYHGLETFDDRYLLGTNEGFSSFDVIDTRTGELVGRTTDVSNPGALLKLPGTTNHFVMTNMGDNTVEVVEVNPGKSIKVISKTKIGVAVADRPKRFAYYYD